MPLQDITPRYIIRDFINILNTMYQNRSETFDHIISQYHFEEDAEDIHEIDE